MKITLHLVLASLIVCSLPLFADETADIEKQIAEIGSIPNEEVMVVQRKFTKKDMRHEITPFVFGGIPFGTIRRTLMTGASYTLHLNDWFAIEPVNIAFSKTFFSSFTDDINANKTRTTQADIKPDFQKLLYFLTAGVQFTPIYGKSSTFSKWIAYLEPYIGFGAGIAKTEAEQYFTFYPAIGIRAYFREWFSMKLEFRDYIYTEKYTTRTTPPQDASSTRNNYAVTVAFSFWLPKMPR